MDAELELTMKGLMQGINIPLEQVRTEICPYCGYKTPICALMIDLHTKDERCRFVCKGMRHWVTENN